jgi:hypothetical protein
MSNTDMFAGCIYCDQSFLQDMYNGQGVCAFAAVSVVQVDSCSAHEPKAGLDGVSDLWSLSCSSSCHCSSCKVQITVSCLDSVYILEP